MMIATVLASHNQLMLARAVRLDLDQRFGCFRAPTSHFINSLSARE
jgi:hypothetical protein